jgi:peroxiredoxin
LREKAKEYQRRDVQPLLVMAQHPFQLRRPKAKGVADAWKKWPDAVPAEVLFDPLSTVSATYGVAFQTQFRGGQNVWSSRPAIFVIDPEGVLRHVDSRPNQDIREAGIFPVVDDLQKQRQLPRH